MSASCVAALWVWGVPNALSPSTFTVISLLVVGGGIVSLVTWRNAQATSTVGQLLQETEAAGSTAPAAVPRHDAGSR